MKHERVNTNYITCIRYHSISLSTWEKKINPFCKRIEKKKDCQKRVERIGDWEIVKEWHNIKSIPSLGPFSDQLLTCNLGTLRQYYTYRLDNMCRCLYWSHYIYTLTWWQYTRVSISPCSWISIFCLPCYLLICKIQEYTSKYTG